MPDSFGARLRQQREDRGIALAKIAQQTRIKQPLLEALERDDLSQWPSGFYRRAFFRAYACAISLEPDAALREFLEVYPEPPQVDVLKAMASALGSAEGNSGMTAGIRDAVGSAIGSLSRLRRSTPEESGNGAAAIYTPATTLSAAPARAFNPDFVEVARLCTALARVENSAELQPLLHDTARAVDGTGLIVWLWDAATAVLTPAFVHGYPQRVVALLPNVRRDADNPTAAAFRTAQPRFVAHGLQTQGALVVPLLTAAGCAGVLAIELQRGTPHVPIVLAVATILAAQLAHTTRQVRRREEAPFSRFAAQL
jgi:transcriptional regulator with XRE-family HTH domain